MIRDLMIPGKQFQCEKCGHVWLSLGHRIPLFCASRKCKSREWNGKKQHVQSHIHEIKFPAPHKGGRQKTNVLLNDIP